MSGFEGTSQNIPVAEPVQSNASAAGQFEIEKSQGDQETGEGATTYSTIDDLNNETNQATEGGDSKNDDGEMDEGPTSSAENVIPVKNLRNGWLAMGQYVRTSCKFAQEKSAEAYNSEQMQALRRRTSEIVAPAWEKTVEATNYAVERTKENVAVAQERMQPTIEELQAKAAVGWQQFMEGANAVSTTCVEQTQTFTARVTTEFNRHTEGMFAGGNAGSDSGNNSTTDSSTTTAGGDAGGGGSGSVLDAATRGGPMHV